MKLFFLGSLAALVGGIYDNVHFKPISTACHSVRGLFAQAFSEQANNGCALANALSPWGTLLIVGGSIGLLISIGLVVYALSNDGKPRSPAA